MTEKQQNKIDLSIPGIEKFLQSPDATEQYVRDYKRSLPYYADPALPEEVRAQAVEFASAFASSRATDVIRDEMITRELATRAIAFGKREIQRRGWGAADKETRNFAWQLLEGSDSALSLRTASMTGRFLESRKASKNKSLFSLRDIPDFEVETFETGMAHEQLVDAFVGDLFRSLGFLREEDQLGDENLPYQEDKIKGEMVTDKSIGIRHPDAPYYARYGYDRRYNRAGSHYIHVVLNTDPRLKHVSPPVV